MRDSLYGVTTRAQRRKKWHRFWEEYPDDIRKVMLESALRTEDFKEVEALCAVDTRMAEICESLWEKVSTERGYRLQYETKLRSGSSLNSSIRRRKNNGTVSVV